MCAVKMEFNPEEMVYDEDGADSYDVVDADDEDFYSEFDDTRFTELQSDTQMECARNSRISDVAKNTMSRNAWAVRLFQVWAASRNRRVVPEACTDKYVLVTKPLHEMADEELIYWLSKFTCEIRKHDGAEYHPKTLLSICMGIQSHLKLQLNKEIRLISDPKYAAFKCSLDAEIERLSKTSGKTPMRKAAGITAEDEEKLWQSQALGGHNPRTLVNTMVYLNGKNFGIKGGGEHRALRPSNITIYTKKGEEFLRYYEGKSHNKPRPCKEIILRASLEMPERCHLRLCKLYLSKCPPLTDFFYALPMTDWTPNGRWYNSSPLGHNSLSKIIPEICQKAGIEGFRTHSSLRATAATQPIVLERTLYRSRPTLGLKRKNTDEDLSINGESSSADGSLMASEKNSYNDFGIQCELQEPETEIPKFGAANAVYYFNNCNVTINNFSDKSQ